MPTVLLVEDHPMNMKLFRDILSFEFDVREATSAEAARETLKDGGLPDLIIMDVQLPGIDGITMIREIKADPRTAAIPVVAISAHAMQRDIDAARDAGCLEYITKPLTEDPFAFLARLKGYARPAGEA